VQLFAAVPGGLDVNAQTSQGETALHIAMKTGHHSEVVRALLNVPGIDVNVQAKSGHTPLHVASCMDPVKTELLLAHKDINVNIKASDGTTPLMYYTKACKYENRRLHQMKLILAHPNILVDAFDRNGCTALYYAAKSNDPRKTQLLINHKANVNTHSFSVKLGTPISATSTVHVASLLWAHGADMDGVYDSVKVTGTCEQRLRTILELERAGVDPNIIAKYLFTYPPHEFIIKGLYDLQ
jgi:ankyrin repeat protein